jgi:hypothetical protein
MSGGGKGGKKTEETTIPSWIRDPAIRNLARAEAVQQLPYMPYYGPEVAAFTPTQNAAFDANIGAGEAFGLLAPNTLTATSGMPTPTEYAGGFRGYSSQGLYDQALAELKAKQPGAVAQYDALFGNTIPAPVYPSSGGSRFRGSAGGNPPLIVPDRNSNYDGNVQKPESIERGNQAVLQAGGSMDDFSDIPGHTVADFQSWSGGEGMYDMGSRAPDYVNTTKIEVAPPYEPKIEVAPPYEPKIEVAPPYERQKNIDKLIKSGVARKTGGKYGFGL